MRTSRERKSDEERDAEVRAEADAQVRGNARSGTPPPPPHFCPRLYEFFAFLSGCVKKGEHNAPRVVYLPPFEYVYSWRSNLTRTPKPHGRSGRTPALPYPPMSKANIIFLYFATYNANCLYCPSVKLHCNTAFTNAVPHAVQASLFSSMSSPSSSLSLYPNCLRASFIIPP